MSDSGIPPQMMEQIQSRAWNMMETRIFEWIGDLDGRIQSKQAADWRGSEAAQDVAAQIEDSANMDAAVRDAVTDILSRFLRVVGTAMSQQHAENPDTSKVSDELKGFIVELHNPEKQELLLLLVKPEYRDDAREWMRELGRMFWGLADVGEGNMTGDAWFLVNQLAATQNQDVRTLVQGIEGVSEADIPDELR